MALYVPLDQETAMNVRLDTSQKSCLWRGGGAGIDSI